MLDKFYHLSEKQKNLHFAKWRERFVEEEYPAILSELGLTGNEKNKLILSPFRSEKHPSFSISFAVENPAHQFLFYDFATQQKGAGTLAFRMLQEGLNPANSDEYLLKVAIQRDYEFYFNKGGRPYIDIVSRYKEKIETVLFYLKKWNIITYPARTRLNQFQEVLKVNPFNIDDVFERLILQLNETFSDENNPELSLSNQSYLKLLSKDFESILKLALEDLTDGVPIYKDDALINILSGGKRLFPYHRFDDVILPIINFNPQFYDSCDKVFITMNLNSAQKVSDKHPVIFIEPEIHLMSQSLSVFSAPKLLRNALHFAAFNSVCLFLDDIDSHLYLGRVLNQLVHPQQVYLYSVEKEKTHFFYDAHLDIAALLLQMEDDEKDMQKFKKNWQESTNEFERKKLGLWNVRKTDEYRNQLFDMIKKWSCSYVNLPTFLSRFLIKPTLQPIPVVEPILNYKSVIQHQSVTEYHNRIKLNNWLSEHLLPAEEFALSRQVSLETLKNFNVGLATSEVYQQGLNDLNFHPLYFNDVQLNQRIFEGLIAFPIKNELGDVIGFGGRHLDKEINPKYINSTAYKIHNEITNQSIPLFDKKTNWYGFYEAKEAILKSGQVIVVEGYMDVLRLHDIGIKNVIATMGASISPEKLTHLSQWVNQIILMLDGDIAGLIGMKKACEQLDDEKVFIICLPDDLDPDSYITKYGGAALKSLLHSGFKPKEFIPWVNQLENFYYHKRKKISPKMVESRKRNVFYYIK